MNFTNRGKSGDDWQTPIKIYKELDNRFHFNFDPCPLNGLENGVNGLFIEWGSSTFVNPPYSDVMPWVRKAYRESQKGKLVVMLLKSETSAKWFHDWVYNKADLEFVKGRLHFNNSDRPAPFCSMIAIYHPKLINTL